MSLLIDFASVTNYAGYRAASVAAFINHAEDNGKPIRIAKSGGSIRAWFEHDPGGCHEAFETEKWKSHRVAR